MDKLLNIEALALSIQLRAHHIPMALPRLPPVSIGDSSEAALDQFTTTVG